MGTGDVTVGIDTPSARAGAGFDGVDDRVETSVTFTSVFKGSFSIEMWLKSDDGQPSTNKYTFGQKTAGASEITMLLPTTGKLTLTYAAGGNNAEIVTANAVFADGQTGWKHTICVLDSTIAGVGGMKIYVNGVDASASGSGDTSGIDFSVFTLTRNFLFGARNLNGSIVTFWPGQIAQVRLYDKALSAAECLRTFNGERLPDNLVGEWMLKDNYNDTAGSNNGTNSGSRLGIFEDAVAASVAAARTTTNDNYIAYENAGNQVAVVTIEEAP